MKNQVLSQTKFKYDYLTNRLWRIDPNSPEYCYEIEDQFPANFGGHGFILGANSWLTFTVYAKSIRAFYKQVTNSGAVIYYRQEVPLVPLGKLPLIIPQKYRDIDFEFTEADRVEKINGYWVRKKESVKS